MIGFGFNKKRKYKNKKTVVDGISFDSQKESKRYLFLKDLENKGIIKDLQRQVKFELIPAIKKEETVFLKTKQKTVKKTEQLPITYTCDFLYTKVEDDTLVIEDVKASKNYAAVDKVYVIKKKMMRALKGLTIKEVYTPTQEI